MIAPGDCAALILAAGASRRFGKGNKLLEPLGGRPLVDHVCETVGSFGFGRAIAVVADAKTAQIAARRRLEIVEATPNGTVGATLNRGSDALQGASMVIIFLGDMPFIPESHIAAMLNAAVPGRPLATRSCDYFGPPALLPFALLAGLPADADRGARPLLKGAPAIEIDAHAIRDFDRASDFSLS